VVHCLPTASTDDLLNALARAAGPSLPPRAMGRHRKGACTSRLGAQVFVEGRRRTEGVLGPAVVDDLGVACGVFDKRNKTAKPRHVRRPLGGVATQATVSFWSCCLPWKGGHEGYGVRRLGRPHFLPDLRLAQDALALELVCTLALCGLTRGARSATGFGGSHLSPSDLEPETSPGCCSHGKVHPSGRKPLKRGGCNRR